MFHKSHRNLTAIFLIVAPILFLGAFTMLQLNFNYPDILRQPAASVMAQFAAGGSGLIANWYVMTFAAVLFIPIAVLLHPFLHDDRTWYMPAATSFGVIAGVVQALGFIRWPFLVPYLARTYLDR
jgi:cytochrome bd-type quinol oxidase subunit 2